MGGVDYNNTNFWDVLVIGIYLSFILAMFVGTAWLVSERNWSPWWFAFTVFFVSLIRVKAGG